MKLMYFMYTLKVLIVFIHALMDSLVDISFAFVGIIS
jgi:hypothetical protein